MTFVDAAGQSAELICRGRAPQIAMSSVRGSARCARRRASGGAVPRHWRKAWRVTCPACGAPLSDTNERPDAHETLRDTSPFGHLWPGSLGRRGDHRALPSAAIASFGVVARCAHARAAGADMAKPCGGERPRPRPGLGARARSFPNSDELARPIKRRVNLLHVAVAALLHLFSARSSWQACLAAIAHPAIFLTPSGMRRSSGGARAFERLCEEARIDAHAHRRKKPS